MKKATLFLILQIFTISLFAQINTDRVLAIGRNALYFEDYVLSIQYFNQVIKSKPWLAEPYFYRAVAKINLDDFKGAEEAEPFFNASVLRSRHRPSKPGEIRRGDRRLPERT